MAFGFGGRRAIKELRMEINENFKLDGFMDLLSRGKVNLIGTLKYLNDEKTEQIIGKQKFPIIIHFKLKITAEENEVRDYLKIFELQQDIIGIEIGFRSHKMTLSGCGEPNGNWRASIDDLSNIEILESKNVPGLEDVAKKSAVKPSKLLKTGHLSNHSRDSPKYSA